MLKIGFVHQWAMVGIIGIIFALIPESPWWLVSQNRPEKAAIILNKCNGKIEGYRVDEQIVSQGHVFTLLKVAHNVL
jgi:hypothetical protein